MIDINEGRTNNYLVHGFFGIMGAIVFFGLSFVFSSFIIIISILLFVSSIFMFSAQNGLEIKINENQYRKYGQIGSWKFGQWKSIAEPKSAHLSMYAANASKGNAPFMGKVATLDTKTLTYDIQMTDAFGKKQIIYDFLDYQKAKKALKEINEKFENPIRNYIAEKLIKNRSKLR